MSNYNKIKVAELDTIITIVSITLVKDEETGDETETLTELGTLHAKRINVSGEEEEEGKIKWLSVRKYLTRYSAQLLADGVTMYIRTDEGDFNIHNVEPEGRKQWLVLKCSKRE